MGKDKVESEGEVLVAHSTFQSQNCEGEHLAKLFPCAPAFQMDVAIGQPTSKTHTH